MVELNLLICLGVVNRTPSVSADDNDAPHKNGTLGSMVFDYMISGFCCFCHTVVPGKFLGVRPSVKLDAVPYITKQYEIIKYPYLEAEINFICCLFVKTSSWFMCERL